MFLQKCKEFPLDMTNKKKKTHVKISTIHTGTVVEFLLWL